MSVAGQFRRVAHIAASGAVMLLDLRCSEACQMLEGHRPNVKKQT